MRDRPPAPAGLRLRPANRLSVTADGRVLVGGDPPRLLRLTAAGGSIVRRWFAGEPVGDSAAERHLARRLLDAGLAHPAPDATPPDLGPVHVVIPARDEPAVLAAAPALADGRPVVVVDDGSAVPLTPVDGVDVLRRDRSGGPGVARTDGAARARTADAAILVFVDADVDVPSGWLDHLLAHFADPAVAAVAPRVRPAVGTSALERYEETFPSLDLGPEPGVVGPGRAVAYVPTAALAIRAEALDAVGGFDPELRVGEDVDLVWRLVAAGFTVRYEPAVTVRHRARSTWRAWFEQRRAYGSSAPMLAVRHGEAVAPARAPIGVYAAVAAAVVTPPAVAAVVAGAELTAAHRRVRRSLGEHHDPGLVNGAMTNAFRSTVLAIPRAGLPLIGVAALGRRPRRRIAGLLVAATAAEVAATTRRIDPVRATALRLVDHFAYGFGLWQRLLRTGSSGLAAVTPKVTAPGVRSEDASADTVGA